MQSALKITLEEFSSAFQRAKPPTGWGKTIAVAYSGGVDSTCLLHLLHQHLQRSKDSPSLLAIHVDHSFRPASQQNAEHCKQWAQARSIPSIITKIRWDSEMFNSVWLTDTNKEEMGRIARYRMIYDVMKERDIDVLLMAHHLDDQVETAVMRSRRKKADVDEGRAAPTAIGIAGMRSCRRWGMGRVPKNPLWYFGFEGMSKWICRPLLEFPKNRLLATAKEENLAYVEDESNADPSLTERNAIRASLQNSEPSIQLRWPHNPFHPEKVEPSPKPALAEYIREYGVLREEIDKAVDEYLVRNTEPSPQGTYHIITSREPPPPSIMRIGIILRILRYISPFPWGSPRAEANRDSEQLMRISKQIWPYKHKDQWKQYVAHGKFDSRSQFCGGSFVLWLPTPYIGAPTTPQLNAIDARRSKEKTYGWIATRQPAMRSSPVHVDVTEQLESRQPFRIVWDTRWLLDFEENALDRLMERRTSNNIPSSSNGTGRFFITAEDQWYQPCIKHSAFLPEHHNVSLVSASGERADPSIKMTFIRSIQAI